MRRTALAIAALALTTGTGPVLAGGGPPKLANVEAGPHVVALYNDSPSLATGSNIITVKIPKLTDEHIVELDLIGPAAQRVAVPLSKVIVLGELDDGEHSHDEGEADDHGADAAGALAADDHGPRGAASHDTSGGHGAPGGAHGVGEAAGAHGVATTGAHAEVSGAAHAAEPDDHEEPPHASLTYLARGSVSLPTAGTWTARLVVRDQHGGEVVGEAPLMVVEGGPSRLYLGATGTVILGSMLFGMIQRRRRTGAALTTR